MIYLLFTAVALIATLAIYGFCAYEGAFAPILRIPQRKDPEGEETEPFSRFLSLLITLAVWLVLLLAQVSLYEQTQTVGLIKLFVLLVMVIAAGIIDFKKRIIPNMLVLFGLVFWVGITVYEISHTEDVKAILFSELVGFLVGFVLLAAVSLLTKGAMGFGDVKLFGIIGLLSGGFCTYSTLLVSLVLSVIVAVIGLVTKKLGKKDSIPFGPCIMLGYIIVLFLGSY